jgi:hypothetical protein
MALRSGFVPVREEAFNWTDTSDCGTSDQDESSFIHGDHEVKVFIHYREEFGHNVWLPS